jgi:ABC-type nitrate/sulfonate/bicarbonate transport system substrate-binding protein
MRMSVFTNSLLCAFIWNVLFCLVPLPSQAADSDDGELTAVKLQLKWKHQFQFAGYYAAIEKGYYRENGLTVELLEAQDGVESAASVLKGDAQFGIATSDLVLMRSEGEPVVALAPVFQHSPMVLLVSKDAHVHNVHELADKPIMLEPHAAELLAYLEFEGFPASRLKTVAHTYNPKPFMDGKVAAMSAYATDEPFLLKQSGVTFLTFTPRSGGVDFYGDTLFTTEAELAEHPKRVKAFLDASIRGWKYALNHPEEIVDLILTKYSKRHSREHLLFEAAASKRLIMPHVVEVGYTNPGRWRHIVNVYKRLGMLKGDFSLQGFMYERNPQPDFTWLYFALGGSLVLALFFFVVTIRTRQLNIAIRKQSVSLRKALEEIKELRGILPICSHCKKIREDGSWHLLEKYLTEHTNATFTHGICADCMEEHFPEDEI